MQDTQAAPSPQDARASEHLDLLFRAVLQFTSDSPADAVIPSADRDGAYIGTGTGTIDGARLSGAASWSLYSGNCLYPLIRSGQSVPDTLNLCTLSPGGFIDTHDGQRIRFDGRGYGLRSPERYLMSATLAFRTDASNYRWLNEVLAIMEGVFDEKAGRARWNVFVPRSASR
jgi:hypothetical protein